MLILSFCLIASSQSPQPAPHLTSAPPGAPGLWDWWLTLQLGAVIVHTILHQGTGAAQLGICPDFSSPGSSRVRLISTTIPIAKPFPPPTGASAPASQLPRSFSRVLGKRQQIDLSVAMLLGVISRRSGCNEARHPPAHAVSSDLMALRLPARAAAPRPAAVNATRS